MFRHSECNGWLTLIEFKSFYTCLYPYVTTGTVGLIDWVSGPMSLGVECFMTVLCTVFRYLRWRMWDEWASGNLIMRFIRLKRKAVLRSGNGKPQTFVSKSSSCNPLPPDYLCSGNCRRSRESSLPFSWLLVYVRIFFVSTETSGVSEVPGSRSGPMSVLGVYFCGSQFFPYSS